jgi:hypothetical protein
VPEVACVGVMANKRARGDKLTVWREEEAQAGVVVAN